MAKKKKTDNEKIIDPNRPDLVPLSGGPGDIIDPDRPALVPLGQVPPGFAQNAAMSPESPPVPLQPLTPQYPVNLGMAPPVDLSAYQNAQYWNFPPMMVQGSGPFPPTQQAVGPQQQYPVNLGTMPPMDLTGFNQNNPHMQMPPMGITGQGPQQTQMPPMTVQGQPPTDLGTMPPMDLTSFNQQPQAAPQHIQKLLPVAP